VLKVYLSKLWATILSKSTPELASQSVFLHVIVQAICKQFLKHFTARTGNLVRHFTINKFAKMSANCKHSVTTFVPYIPKCKKKSLKKRGNFSPIAFVWHLSSVKKRVQAHSRPTTDNWFIGLSVRIDAISNWHIRN
jgi:hypothetical protein